MTDFAQATVSPKLPASLFSEQEMLALESACGLENEEVDDKLFFYSEGAFEREGEDDDRRPIDILAFFQEKLRLLPEAEYPQVIIEGSYTSTRMSEPEYGGFAWFITREDIRFQSTSKWIDEQLTAEAPAPILIEIRGGVVVEVSGVPAGMRYEVKDWDELQADEERDNA